MFEALQNWWSQRSIWVQGLMLGAVAYLIFLVVSGLISGGPGDDEFAAGDTLPPTTQTSTTLSGTSSTTTDAVSSTTTTTLVDSITTTSLAPAESSTTSAEPSTTTTSAFTTTTAQTLPPGSDVVALVSVTDGDTIDVRFPDGTIDTVRLIGINSPETGECFAAEATDALEALLTEDILMTSDVSDRDQYERLLRYLWVTDGVFVNEELVLGGFALALEYPPDTAHADRLAAAQAQAETAQIGLWAPDVCGPPTSGALMIFHVEFDAAGNDNENLNGEWVDIRNTGTVAQDMTGWVLKDESASHRYAFPTSISLGAAQSLRVHTGCGDDTATSLYWCSGGAVWNNDGDTAFLLDNRGNIASHFSY
jgi:micrococcal nuclease